MTAKVDKRRVIPSRAFLNSVFRYENGKLFWKERPRDHFASQRAASVWNTMCKGKRAGGERKSGYRDVCIDGVRYLEHRVIAAFHWGTLGASEVDHINGDKSDNRIENLRLCTHTENALNRPGKANGLPKHVYFSKREQKYKVSMRSRGQRYYLGTFDTLEQAEVVARKSRAELHGEFSNGEVS